MAHFARLDHNNIVIDTIVVSNLDCFDYDAGCESEEVGVEYCKQLFGDDDKWVQSSYSARIRGNHAAIGYIYDEELDIFIPPDKPFSCWVLSLEVPKQWEAPIAVPDETKPYYWDEDAYQQDNTQGWVLFTPTPDDQEEPEDEPEDAGEQ